MLTAELRQKVTGSTSYRSLALVLNITKDNATRYRHSVKEKVKTFPVLVLESDAYLAPVRFLVFTVAHHIGGKIRSFCFGHGMPLLGGPSTRLPKNL